MKDKRNEILAKNLVNYSVSLKSGETIMIEIKGKETLELAKSRVFLEQMADSINVRGKSLNFKRSDLSIQTV